MSETVQKFADVIYGWFLKLRNHAYVAREESQDTEEGHLLRGIVNWLGVA